MQAVMAYLGAVALGGALVAVGVWLGGRTKRA